MLELTRKGNDVWNGTTKLTRVDQATKGPGNEVIKIEGLSGANGAKWISLSKLKQGLNEVEVSGKKASSTTNTQSYTLTKDEKFLIDGWKEQIEKVINVAKSRYVKLPTYEEVTTMSPEEREEKALEVEKYLKTLRG